MAPRSPGSGTSRRTCTRRRGSRTVPSVPLHRRRLRGLSLGDELVDFLAHGLDDILLGHLADDLAALEDEADPTSPGHADVGGARLARTVDLAPHDRDVNLLVESLELVLDLLRQLDEVDVGPTAGRARDEREAPASQTERFQNIDPDAHLFGRIGRERDA